MFKSIEIKYGIIQNLHILNQCYFEITNFIKI